jgi:colanic acid/amylovoran biosynthesis glycosyltransferase
MKIAYFVNLYPTVSHTFIRREIESLESLGMSVMRYSLRGWDSTLVDPADIAERERTSYVLLRGTPKLAFHVLKQALQNPVGLLKAIGLALRISKRSDRSLFLHLISVAEAAVLVSWAKRDGIKHLHVHFGTNSTEVAMLARSIGGLTYSFTVHGSDEWDHPREVRIGEKVHRSLFVVGISQYTRAQLMRWSGPANHSKIQVIHCGLHDDFLSSAYVPPSRKPEFLCVGRLCTAKAQLLLVRAISVLKTSNPDVRLTLIGDGESRAEITQLIAELKLEQHVRLLGWASSATIREHLQASRTFVLPSFAEGLPVVIMEAMALGRPVISTYIAGIPELIRPGIDGWLVPAGDENSLVTAMQEALNLDAAGLERMALSARTRVAERHNQAREGAKLKALFDHYLSTESGKQD